MADKGALKQVSADQVKCVDCGNEIADDTKALNCEKCMKSWKCTSCIGIRVSTYEDLVSDAGRDLHWFCDPCYRDVLNQTSNTQLLGALEKLATRMTRMEEQLGNKVDRTMISSLETMVEKKVSGGYDAFSMSVERQIAKEMQEMRGMVNKELQESSAKDNIVSVEQKVMKLVETVEKQRADSHDLRDCVQDAVRDKLQEDQEETEDVKRRSKNIIIHGLSEVPDGDSEARRSAEENQLQDLLHEMKCDDLSIQSLVRFGAYQDSQQKPRPLRVELASDQQREQATAKAKKLAWQSDICTGVYTEGPDSKAEGEATTVGAGVEAKEGQWRSGFDNNPRQDSGQKDERDVYLRFLYTNANSLFNKMSELRDKTTENKYDVIGITETWATPAISDAELSIEGYSMFRKDRSCLKGGGLILYVSHRVRACINDKLADNDFEESLWCNVELEQKRLLIGLCYRSPSSNAENDRDLVNVMEKAATSAGVHQVVILGDFNFPHIDYENENVTAGDDPATLFFNKTQELCLYQHVRKPTRYRQHQIPSTLDFVFTDEENLIDMIQFDDPLGKSDHVVLSWDLQLASPEMTSIQAKYDYYKGNFVAIQSSLQCIDWNECWRDMSVNDMWHDFVQLIREQVALHVPLRKQYKKKKAKLSKKRGDYSS